MHSHTHFEFMTAIDAMLKEKKLVVWEHFYSPGSFGSWYVIIGKSKKRLRFAWDGKERALETSLSTFGFQSKSADWKELHCIDFFEQVRQAGTTDFLYDRWFKEIDLATTANF